MDPSLGSRITKAASSQTYYTIRLLVDRPRVEDAFRAYAYFRWLDDLLDGPELSGPGSPGAQDFVRERLLERQEALLDECLQGERPSPADPHEAMLVELISHAEPADGGLEAYLRRMMQVMKFDVRRRGQLVSGHELDEYTRSLAIAVTEAMHHFIGHGDPTPHDEARYLAVTGAHILHMLRDTYDDLRAGYYKVPREVLEASSIGPAEIETDPYRAWVAARVKLARDYLDAGKGYFARIPSRRHRLAGLAYIGRFEWLIETLERDGYRLRPDYSDVSASITLRMAWRAIQSLTGRRGPSARARAIAFCQRGRP